VLREDVRDGIAYQSGAVEVARDQHLVGRLFSEVTRNQRNKFRAVTL
jgi:hypothetical protein